MGSFTPQLIMNVLGNGNDGAIVFNGSTTPVAGATLVGSTYTVTRDIYATDCTVNNSIVLKMQGFRLFVNGTLLNNGTISSAGNDASGLTGGAIISATGVFQCAAGNGANGRNTLGAGSNAGGSGGNNIAGSTGGDGGQADGGNLGGSGGTSAGPSSNAGGVRHILPWLWGRIPGGTGTALLPMSGSTGGGSGGCQPASGTASSGSGGSAGILMAIFCNVLNNTGTITANGGAGSNASATVDGKAGGGGGGAGGSVAVFYKTLISQGTITANGGALGTGAGSGANGTAGSNGITLVQKLGA